jgi:hypothetical protein
MNLGLRFPRVPIGAMVVAAAVATTIGLGQPFAVASAYRYWTYWSATATGSWTFSPVGPASAVPRDGAVEGWRFAVSTGTRGQGAQPRIPPAEAFQRFCGAVSPRAGTKRVAVVFDFGDATDAPPGQTPPASRGACAQVPTGATGSQLLQSVADVRAEGGLVCALGGYPVGECAPAVADPQAGSAPKPKPAASSSVGRQEAPAPRTTPPAASREAVAPGRTARAVPSTGPSASAAVPTPVRSVAEPTVGGGIAAAGSGSPSPRGTSDPDPRTTASAAPSAATSAVPGAPATSPAPQFVAAEARSDPPSGAGPWLWVALLALLGLGGWAIHRAR